MSDIKKLQLLLRCACALCYLSECVCVSVYHNNAIISQQIQGKTHTLYHFSIGRFTSVWWVDKFLLFLYGRRAQKARDGWMVGCLVGKGSIEHIEALCRSAVLSLCEFKSCARCWENTLFTEARKKSPAHKSATIARRCMVSLWRSPLHYTLSQVVGGICFFRLGRSASGHSSRLRGSLPLSLTSTHHTGREREAPDFMSSDSSMLRGMCKREKNMHNYKVAYTCYPNKLIFWSTCTFFKYEICVYFW